MLDERDPHELGIAGRPHDTADGARVVMTTKVAAMLMVGAAGLALWLSWPSAAEPQATLPAKTAAGDTRPADTGSDPQLRFAGKRFDDALKTEVVTWFGGKEATDELRFEGRGRLGGRLVTGQSQTPREFNPITSRSAASGDIVNQALFVALIDYNYD